MAPAARNAIPKYTVRLVLLWLIPGLSLLLGFWHWGPAVLAAVLTPIEVPKARQLLFTAKTRKQLPCFRVPALLRLSALWLVQVWWLLVSRASDEGLDADVAPVIEDIDLAGVDLNSEASAAWDDGPNMKAEDLAWKPASMSVVLPCAGEGQYALNTVKAVHETVPAEVLKEIIVVDDGSSPPLTTDVLPEEVQLKYGVKVIRHSSGVGLIGAKKHGGDAASGDVIVFFDCHVAPQAGWHDSFLRLMAENYRRIVVPVITDLDVGTWKQRGENSGQSKCYLTLDADFKWFNSADNDVPILSGGLLAISRRWWNETGGYDEQMSGWGGENLDQSLRSWLCGGEVKIATDAHVAHMWRVPSDPRTKAHYWVMASTAAKNRMRAASAWFGEFGAKLRHFPELGAESKAWGGGPWYGDLGNILEVRDRLKCRSFAWFMHRFSHVYVDGGILPEETFLLKAPRAGKCLTYTGAAGTAPNGDGKAVLRSCDPSDHRQRWHGANRDTKTSELRCCSGLKAWNTDQCLTGADGSSATTTVCDISGKAADQLWRLDDSGRLTQTMGRPGVFLAATPCLQADGWGYLSVKPCGGSADSAWERRARAEPVETTLYRRALAKESRRGR